MPRSDVDVVVVGGGAAGVAAARRLRQAGVDCLIVEARGRLGGRAFTITNESGFALDLGCGWLHSADRNPWVKIAQDHARVVTPDPAPMGVRPTATAPPRPALTHIPATERARAARGAAAPEPALTPGPNRPAAPRLAPDATSTSPASRLASRVKIVPLAEPPRGARVGAWSPPTPAALGMGAAIATAILLAIDRKLLIPLLIVAGVMGARAIARLPTGALRETLLADPGPDDDVNDLEKRVRRLAKRA